jgi:hypothetical protein
MPELVTVMFVSPPVEQASGYIVQVPRNRAGISTRDLTLVEECEGVACAAGSAVKERQTHNTPTRCLISSSIDHSSKLTRIG